MTVRVEDVTVGYGDPVLRDVSLTATAGELVGLVGPNGAGKTTLLRAVNGSLTPTTGRVAVDGADVSALPSRAASRRVATVPQEARLDFGFSVREVVAMGRHAHRPRLRVDPDPDAVGRALDRTATCELADRPVTGLSGGERQRVLLARAVAQDAPVLVLDEPTASLDVTHQLRTLELVTDLVAEGRTALAAVHDLNLAARYCDRLVVLADGGVRAAGPPSAVLTDETLRSAFGVRAAVTRDPVTGAPHVTAVPDGDGEEHGRVHVLGGGGAAAPYLHPLAAAGFAVSVGPVPTGDRDAEVARALDLERVEVSPFAAVDGDERRRARDRAGRPAATALAPVPGRPAAVADLAAHGRPLVAASAWEGVDATLAGDDPDDLVAAVADAVAAPSAVPPREVPRRRD